MGFTHLCQYVIMQKQINTEVFWWFGFGFLGFLLVFFLHYQLVFTVAKSCSEKFLFPTVHEHLK